MELGVDCNLQLAASRRMVLLSSAPGSKSPLGRGGGATHHALGVRSVFPVVSVRLCGCNDRLFDLALSQCIRREAVVGRMRSARGMAGGHGALDVGWRDMLLGDRGSQDICICPGSGSGPTFLTF